LQEKHFYEPLSFHANHQPFTAKTKEFKYGEESENVSNISQKHDTGRDARNINPVNTHKKKPHTAKRLQTNSIGKNPMSLSYDKRRVELTRQIAVGFSWYRPRPSFPSGKRGDTTVHHQPQTDQGSLSGRRVILQGGVKPDTDRQGFPFRGGVIPDRDRSGFPFMGGYYGFPLGRGGNRHRQVRFSVQGRVIPETDRPWCPFREG
jgi:hypothetical protein